MYPACNHQFPGSLAPSVHNPNFQLRDGIELSFKDIAHHLGWLFVWDAQPQIPAMNVTGLFVSVSSVNLWLTY